MNSEDIYNRPALKEINSNESTSGALSSNNQNKLTAKSPHNKQQQQDFKQLESAVNLSFNLNNDALSENLYTNAERRKINCFDDSNEISFDSVLLGRPVGILQPQSIASLSQPPLEDSLVSSLAANLDAALVLNTTTGDINQSNTLSLPLEPESSSSHVSSDNETYVECRSFSPDTNFAGEESNCFTSALDLVSITDPSSHGWEDLVTSVTEMNMDSLENINEQLDVQLDMTPTETAGSEFLDLPDAKVKEEETLQSPDSSPEQTVVVNEESENLDVTTCMEPETIALKVANLIENVDTNSCDHAKDALEKSQELSVAPSIDIPPSELDITTTVDEKENCDIASVDADITAILNENVYCNNVTVEADKFFSQHNESATLPINSADKSVVLSWATVEQALEKLSTPTGSESELNLTQEVIRSSSASSSCLQLDVRSVTPSQSEDAAASPNSSSKFPLRTTSDNGAFPKSPTMCDSVPPNFPNVLPSSSQQSISRSASVTKLEQVVDPNQTIDIIQTSPNGTCSNPSTGGENLPNPMDSTFTANNDILNATTTVNAPSAFDQTFDGTSGEVTENKRSPSPSINNQTFNGNSGETTPNRVNEKSPSPSINNQTVNLDEHKLNDDTRNFEPMDVDTNSPNPNETASFSTFPSTVSSDSLSEKEKCDAKDEKDVFVEKCASLNQGAFEEMFQSSKGQSMGFPGKFGQPSDLAADEDFQSNRLFLNPSDFDFLLTKGNNSVQVDRSSLLLRFDPLLGHSVPVNQPVKAGSSVLSAFTAVDKQQQQERLSPANEEEEQFCDSNRSFQKENDALNLTQSQKKPTAKKSEERQSDEDRKQKPLQVTTRSIKKNVKMSVDVMQDMKIENDCKSIEEIDTQTDEKHNFKMDELEKKIKNEVLKTEDIEKKLKEAEQREEALIKRITEKDKTITKMNGVIEAYEKAIAELIAEKEQIIQNYEKQLTEVKTDRDSNYHHLTSLETTFSDLHVKYEKSKEMTAQLKSSEESLLAEKRQNLENLRLQEQRYEKMKNHAMQQLEIANKKLESLTKNHSMEITKLKALLKKEEISRASINEQLQQKSRENEELVKICDELINGQGS